MATITITIKDNFDGTVKVICDPNFETIMKGQISGAMKTTAAHGYAIAAMKRIFEVSTSSGNLNIKIPKLIS